MKKLLYYVEFGILGMIVWVILYESLSLYTVISGLVLGAGAALFANVFLTTEKLTSAYRFNIPMLGLFVLVLIYRIYKAGISAIPDIIRGRCRTSIIDIETKVPEGLAATTLANSITLTPGTVTIDKTGQRIKVLCLNSETDDPVEAARIINGSLERILIKAAKND
ncbi:MAG TPA: Na+/H+ antiporter subunit E [Clostridia bacterium]|jgi:multisubunit Na+/H+ antiporter MnhE subunit|nr:Na+/H+ antiporter subunit E [Clostridia bacterium]HRX42775.1 Na+/H+ antiporter subunit E [Clostridia bacterium]